jgi:hypothetical protein
MGRKKSRSDQKIQAKNVNILAQFSEKYISFIYALEDLEHTSIQI